MTRARRFAARLGLPLATSVSLLSTIGIANASPDLVVDGQTVSLSGTLHYRYVRVLNGGSIVVPPYDGQPGTTTGRLELIATDILVDATSAINANSAGFRGLLDQNGEGLAGGQGALVSTDATGGGGHAGKGGDGVLLAGCASIPGATGGAALTGSLTDVTFGSAGAAAGTADGDSGGRGGSGGGAILLRAGRVEITGSISANGEPGQVVADDSSGGGAGGGVLVQASYLLSFGGQIEVLGASGGTSTDDEGGGGGGGRVLLLVPAIPTDLHLNILGGAATCPAAQGAVGQAKLASQSGCIDLDGDGYTSAGCGGPDCDDSDPDVHPTATEACNGQDDDCSGTIDDHGASSSCNGAPCVAGACAGVDAGPDAVADAGAEADGDEASTDAESEPDAESLEGATDKDVEDADAPAVEEAGGNASADVPQEASLVLRGGCHASPGAKAGSRSWLGLAFAALLFERLRWSRSEARQKRRSGSNGRSRRFRGAT